jgi:hypothetical protein
VERGKKKLFLRPGPVHILLSRREKPVGAAAQYIHIRIFIHNDVYHEGGWRENTEHPPLLLLMKQNIFTVSYALVFSFYSTRI